MAMLAVTALWNADDGMDLLQRLSQLEAQSKGAPLVSILEGHNHELGLTLSLR